MKILYIHQYFKTRIGTKGTRSYEMAKYFKRQGHEITMLTSHRHLKEYTPVRVFKSYKEYEIDGIKVISVDNEYSGRMNTFKRIKSFLSFMYKSSKVAIAQKKTYDLVYATSTPLTIAFPALLMKKINKVPFVFEVRDLWPEAPIQMGVIKNPVLKKFLRWFEKKTYKEASHIVTLSPGMRNGVISHQEIDQKKVTMAPNSCDLDLFSESVSKREQERLMNDFSLENKFVVTHAGTINTANGIEYILEAAKLLKEKGNNRVLFLLVGEGNKKEWAESYVKEHKLDNVIFVGEVSRIKIPLIMSVTDITITSFQNVPILRTNSPNKFFDSLAAGKPVIVNSSGWTKDIVENEGIGYYVEEGEPKSLVNLLVQIQDQKEKMRFKGHLAQHVAEKYFERNKVNQRILKAIEH
ncbi:glycosyltransferase family 4 protein [Salsuginibacillus kocurii]|uniref:glycosyltransferase family 4 protein n=1 Tax=Salsuginibacillus kocurii TaxID=427078 RepID=UPI00036E0AA4|nr:glycosyltransferase family 4 protein [Salsuginibacillus kocurii]